MSQTGPFPIPVEPSGTVNSSGAGYFGYFRSVMSLLGFYPNIWFISVVKWVYLCFCLVHVFCEVVVPLRAHKQYDFKGGTRKVVRSN